jgi:hypothetical protein
MAWEYFTDDEVPGEMFVPLRHDAPSGSSHQGHRGSSIDQYLAATGSAGGAFPNNQLNR